MDEAEKVLLLGIYSKPEEGDKLRKILICWDGCGGGIRDGNISDWPYSVLWNSVEKAIYCLGGQQSSDTILT